MKAFCCPAVVGDALPSMVQPKLPVIWTDNHRLFSRRASQRSHFLERKADTEKVEDSIFSSAVSAVVLGGNPGFESPSFGF
jgi:hypothetical protein